MKYLTGEEVLVLHHEIIEETGGLHGVRDTGLFQSILAKPRMTFGGKELYLGTFMKAAVYCASFAQYHVFSDGNKRTAFAAAVRFLYLNHYEVVVPNNVVEDFIIEVATKKHDDAAIAAWFKKYSKKK